VLEAEAATIALDDAFALALDTLRVSRQGAAVGTEGRSPSYDATRSSRGG